MDPQLKSSLRRALANARADRTEDAAVVRQAADILERRSKKPDGFWLGVGLRVLRDAADRIAEPS